MSVYLVYTLRSLQGGSTDPVRSGRNRFSPQQRHQEALLTAEKEGSRRNRRQRQAADFPERYDSRDYGRHRTCGIRSLGTCWAVASVRCLEASRFLRNISGFPYHLSLHPGFWHTHSVTLDDLRKTGDVPQEAARLQGRNRSYPTWVRLPDSITSVPFHNPWNPYLSGKSAASSVSASCFSCCPSFSAVKRASGASVVVRLCSFTSRINRLPELVTCRQIDTHTQRSPGLEIHYEHKLFSSCSVSEDVTEN